MRTVVHLSDLHFGRIDQALLAPLIEQIHAATPDLIVVSGDLTQRAKSAQFIAAREFLDALPQPQIVVPGNHDVPLYSVFERMVDPHRLYREIISSDLNPVLRVKGAVIVGVDSTDFSGC